jgi:hypothetical protein
VIKFSISLVWVAVNFCPMVYRYANLNGSSTTSIDPVCDVSAPKRHLRTKVPLNNRAQTDSDAKLVVREILDHGCKAALFERKLYTIVVLIFGRCPWSVPPVFAPCLCPWSLPPDSAARDCHRPKIKSSGEIISISDYASIDMTSRFTG